MGIDTYQLTYLVYNSFNTFKTTCFSSVATAFSIVPKSVLLRTELEVGEQD